MSSTHHVTLVPAGDYWQNHYGITAKSEFVYRTTAGPGPTRIRVWDNTRRPNPRNGQPVRFGDYGPIDGGDGQYLDPNNVATDSETSYLLSPEATTIDAYGTGTGTPGSGQVYAEGIRLAALDVLMIDGAAFLVTFTNNGHGYLTRV